MNNEKKFGFIGEIHVSYADMISEKDPVTMLLRILYGFIAKIHPLTIIFKNDNRSHTTREVLDILLGMCYRSF